MTIFDDIKELVDVPTAARSYGVEVHRGNMALCPFHRERHRDKAGAGAFRTEGDRSGETAQQRFRAWSGLGQAARCGSSQQTAQGDRRA